ncbi:MAG: 16S rRNA (cytosine(1402)-N(4))-methyltransferase RsmH [Planctomycetota bacterium]
MFAWKQNTALMDEILNCSQIEHVPVLAETLAELVDLPKDGVMVDVTIGQGGHSLQFGHFLGPEGAIVGFDIDKKAIQRAHIVLKDLSCRVILIHSNFSEIREKLIEHEIGEVDFILADLGVSSIQLADVEMGLSFTSNMPLDMRLDKRLKLTAADIVNKSDEKSLADLIYQYGQDRASRRIARFLVRQRGKHPIKTTSELADVVCRALGKGKGRGSRIHPATRTFQALRIAVNKELECLDSLLSAGPDLLAKGGKIAIISFHSLEDRAVKNNFRENKKEGIYKLLTKKPIVPSRAEIFKNRRARSAKLRIAEKQ